MGETSSTTPDRGFPLTTTSDEATTETHSHAVLQTDRLNMIAQRVGVAAARGAAKPFIAQNMSRLALAARIHTTQSKSIDTAKLTPTEGNDILAKQRLNRPIAPHLGIYKLNQSWFGHSAWTRITGCTLSGAAYVYFTSYLVAPLFGWHIESAALAESFSNHFINGCRHLVFDLGKGFDKATIVKTETVTWIASAVGALFLAFGL